VSLCVPVCVSQCVSLTQRVSLCVTDSSGKSVLSMAGCSISRVTPFCESNEFTGMETTSAR